VVLGDRRRLNHNGRQQVLFFQRVIFVVVRRQVGLCQQLKGKVIGLAPSPIDNLVALNFLDADCAKFTEDIVLIRRLHEAAAN